jgi:hypothetical protein
METPFGARELWGLLLPAFTYAFNFLRRVVFEKTPFVQSVAFENSRVAAQTFWKRVGGFHENCLRMARRPQRDLETSSAIRVVFVARPFSEMLGTPKGCGIGSPFLWFLSFGEAKERN